MLKRKKYPMPDFIKSELIKNGLMDKYNQRPDYQKNDYIGWITRSVKPETKQKRLNQMITELKKGNVYMNMNWNIKK